MKGKHHIIIDAPRLRYEFEIKRNITILQGESASGKTTLIDLLTDYASNKDNSPIRIMSDVPCEVYIAGGERWQPVLQSIENSIVFIDEGNPFIRSKDFAELVRGSSNYFVLITRDSLPELPYSIHEIYGIRTSGKYHFPEKIYHEFYPIFGESPELRAGDSADPMNVIITEDSKAGYQFMEAVCNPKLECISANGNANVYRTMRQQPETDQLTVLADGAAFGAFISDVLAYALERRKVRLYFPESFEWVILLSGVVDGNEVEKILACPEDYIEGSAFFSWEQFFTEYLRKITKDDEIRHYQKEHLRSYYKTGQVMERIKSVFPEEIQNMLDKCDS